MTLCAGAPSGDAKPRLHGPHAPQNSQNTTPSSARSPARSVPPAQVDSAKANLAATYVNAFVNAGYGT